MTHLSCHAVLSDTLIESFAMGLGSELRVLDFRQCTALTDAALLHIANHCPRLVGLALSDNDNVCCVLG